MTHVFHGVDEFRAAAGLDLGAGEWFTVTQDRIDGFADVTEDWQWIHVDPERAAASDMGTTVAHGYLTLSLVPRLSSALFTFEGVGRAINASKSARPCGARISTPLGPSRAAIAVAVSGHCATASARS